MAHLFSVNDQKIIKDWMMNLSHEVVVEIIIHDDHHLELGQLLSVPPTLSNSCNPTNVEVRDIMMHTHPKACYIRNRVKYGWPSGQDFYSMLTHGLTIHFVMSLEGLYIIHIDEETIERWHSLSKKEQSRWIKMLDIPGNKGNIEEFLDTMDMLGWVHIEFIPHEFIPHEFIPHHG